MVKQVLRPNLPQAGHEEFQLELKNRFAALETPTNVDEDLESIVGAVREVGTKHFRKWRTDKKSKLSSEALELMRIRRETPEDALPDPQSLNKKIRSMIKHIIKKTLDWAFTNCSKVCIYASWLALRSRMSREPANVNAWLRASHRTFDK
ncbi:hypothetical protein NE865_04136 [Phthorimaea operculella]|nr:hypothetical protein NE865_04136 [Phthorimaea operculella]